MTIIRTYDELIKLPTFEDRLNYLRLDGIVGVDTFGNNRYLNQRLYHSSEWRRMRDRVIVRDNGCDLGIDGLEIFDIIIVHHINPITLEDLYYMSPKVFDMNNLISSSLNTHNKIHYEKKESIKMDTVRKPNDTCPWRR